MANQNLPLIKAYNGQIFLLSEINDLMDEYGIPSEEKCQAEERLKYHKYIEAQVCDDSIINEYITKPNN